jgi:ABC-type multidrug transport system ATPase subunit
VLGEEVTLTWRNLTYDVPVLVKDGKNNLKQKRILHGLSGHCAAGQVVAVMGPSGSGKTSLIHILGGRRESGVSGDFVINGTPQTSTLRLLGEIGYVTQVGGPFVRDAS